MTILTNSFQSQQQQPPPPYINYYSNINTSLIKLEPNLLNLPDHLILNILSNLNLIDLTFNIRTLNKKLQIFSKNLLRLKLLPSWLNKIRNNYSSDPLGLTQFQEEENRESKILDLFVTSVSQKELLLGESTLHLSLELSASESAERDLFNLLQPRARLEDLIIVKGKSIGLVRNRGISGNFRSDNIMIKEGDVRVGVIREQDISVDLTGKSAKLLLPFESSSSRGRVVNKGVVEVNRTEKDSLEGIAEILLDRLSVIGLVREGNSSTSWYRKL